MPAPRSAWPSPPTRTPLHSGLLSDVTMLMVEQARSELARSYDLIKEALECTKLDAPARARLLRKLQGPLVDESTSHGATIGPVAAEQLGLPVTVADPDGSRWQIIWSLWTRYFALGAWPAGAVSVYEGRHASQIRGR